MVHSHILLVEATTLFLLTVNYMGKSINVIWVYNFEFLKLQFCFYVFIIMDLIHYSFVPLILFRVPYMLDLLP